MRVTGKRWIAALLLVGACLGGLGGVAWADDGPLKPPPAPPPVESQLDGSVRAVPTILKRQGTNETGANSSGSSALVGAQGAGTGSTTSGFFGGKLWGFLKDHGKGLLMGLAVGAAVAAVIVLAPIVLPVLAGAAVATLASTTVTALATTAVVSGGLYGLMAGAQNFSVTECVGTTAIAVLGVAAGAGLAAAGVTGRVLMWGKIAVNAVEGGVVNVASYLIGDPDPTLFGALKRFGMGMVLATGFLAVGNAVSKAISAYRLARGLIDLPLEDLVGSLGGGGARAGAVVTRDVSEPAALARVQRMLDAEARRSRVIRNIAETRASGASEPSATTQPRASVLHDYRGRVDNDLGTCFDLTRPITLHEGPLTEELVLVQFHADTPLRDVDGSLVRSLKWWTVLDQANEFSTADEVMEGLALVPEWGERNALSVARIPKGTKVNYYRGLAGEQKSKLTKQVMGGGGVQLRFLQFDEQWVVTTKTSR